jgi:hypothetical protein
VESYLITWNRSLGVRNVLCHELAACVNNVSRSQ